MEQESRLAEQAPDPGSARASGPESGSCSEHESAYSTSYCDDDDDGDDDEEEEGYDASSSDASHSNKPSPLRSSARGNGNPTASSSVGGGLSNGSGSTARGWTEGLVAASACGSHHYGSSLDYTTIYSCLDPNTSGGGSGGGGGGGSSGKQASRRYARRGSRADHNHHHYHQRRQKPQTQPSPLSDAAFFRRYDAMYSLFAAHLEGHPRFAALYQQRSGRGTAAAAPAAAMAEPGATGSAAPSTEELLIGAADAPLARLRAMIPATMFQEDFDGGAYLAELLHDAEPPPSPSPASGEPDLLASTKAGLGLAMDLVEAEIVREVSLRSRSFFEEAVIIHDVCSVTREALTRCEGIRLLLRKRMIALADDIRAAQKLQERKDRYRSALQCLELVGSIEALCQQADTLLAARQFWECVQVLNRIDGLTQAESATGIQCLQSVTKRTQKTRNSVSKAVGAEFIQLTVRRLASSQEEPLSTIDAETYGALLQMAQCLRETKRLAAVVRVCKSKCLGPTQMDLDRRAKAMQSELPELVEAAPFQDLEALYSVAHALLQRALVLRQLVFEALNSDSASASAESSQHSVGYEALYAVNDVCKEVFTAIMDSFRTFLAFRKDLWTSLPVSTFFSFREILISHTRSLHRVLAASLTSAHVGVSVVESFQAVTEALDDQAELLLANADEKANTKLMAAVDSDTWVAVDVPAQFQDMARALFGLPATSGADGSGSPGVGSDTLSHLAARPLVCESECFCLSASGLELLKLAYNLKQIGVQLPKILSVCVKRISEAVVVFSDALKVQVIEGRAVTTAGLKSISMRVMMVSSANLRFCMYLLSKLIKSERSSCSDDCIMSCEYAKSSLFHHRENLKAITLDVLTDKTLQQYIRTLPSKMAEKFMSSPVSMSEEASIAPVTPLAETLLKAVKSAVDIIPRASIPKNETREILEIVYEEYDSALAQAIGAIEAKCVTDGMRHILYAEVQKIDEVLRLLKGTIGNEHEDSEFELVLQRFDGGHESDEA